MIDRGMIKWQPFNSIVSGPKIVQEIMGEKNKKIMPTLSEEQLATIENNLLKAYHTRAISSIKYYYNGTIIIKKTYILNVNTYSHIIIIDNGYKINFDQIIEIRI